MAKTPNFDEITNSITQADIDKFLRTAGPEDFKEQVRSAPDPLTQRRFVAGYLIRTNQITPERLGEKAAKKARAAASGLPVKPKAKAAPRRRAPATGTASGGEGSAVAATNEASPENAGSSGTEG